jgi:hypothetical protein
MTSNSEAAARGGQAQFRARMSEDYLAIERRIMSAYQSVLRSLDGTLAEIRKAANDDNTVSGRDMLKTSAVQHLRDETRTAMEQFATVIEQQSERAAASGIAASASLASKLLQASGVESANHPSIEALRQVVSYVDSPAFQANIAKFGMYHADQVADIIAAGAAAGKNPGTIARQLTNYINDFPAADANRIVRTVQIWSARQGTLETFRANADVVTGWMWSASLDPRCCMSCVAMQGTFHDLEETLDDHYSGRCAPIPITKTWGDLGYSSGDEVAGVQSGADWLAGRTDDQQQAQMGNAAWQAWQDGAFDLSDYPTAYDDDVYGQMRRAASLVELVGQDAARQYKYGK